MNASVAEPENASHTLAQEESEDTHFPPRIERAIARLMSPAFVMSLVLKGAMAALLYRVNQNGQGNFWVKRENFGEIMGCTDRTIGNWLKGLEDMGLIQKVQLRKGRGRFSCCELELTPKAVRLLKLDRPLVARNCAREKDFSSRLYEPRNQHPSDGKPADEKSFDAQSYPQQDSFQRIQLNNGDHISIPHDCMPLVESGLKPTLVLSLMKKASQQGKKLGDIVCLRHDAIKKARTPYGFTKALIAANVDYGYLRQYEAQKKIKSEVKAQIKKTVDDGRKALRDTWHEVLCKDASGDTVSNGFRAHVQSDGFIWLYRITAEGTPVFERLLMADEAKEFWRRKGRYSLMRPFVKASPSEDAHRKVQTELAALRILKQKYQQGIAARLQD